MGRLAAKPLPPGASPTLQSEGQPRMAHEWAYWHLGPLWRNTPGKQKTGGEVEGYTHADTKKKKLDTRANTQKIYYLSKSHASDSLHWHSLQVLTTLPFPWRAVLSEPLDCLSFTALHWVHTEEGNGPHHWPRASRRTLHTNSAGTPLDGSFWAHGCGHSPNWGT